MVVTYTRSLEQARSCAACAIVPPYRNYKLHVHVSNELSRLNLDTGAIFTELKKEETPHFLDEKKKKKPLYDVLEKTSSQKKKGMQ